MTDSQPLANSNTRTYLNIGCGSRYHPSWLNLDVAPVGPGVIACDVTNGIPLQDGTCDVVYHSHVLEHVRPPQVPAFMAECHRVLKPGGTMRLAVPDLERIARTYLEKLDAALAVDQQAARDYRWIMLELYDQTVREKSGGGMQDYLSCDPIPNEQFVVSRLGEEARTIIKAIRDQRNRLPKGSQGERPMRRRMRRVGRLIRSLLNGNGRRAMSKFLLSPEDFRALSIGRFRLAGEVHQWMYDRYSLRELLLSSGFIEPLQREASTSRIEGWSRFNLDTLEDGTVVKPDSIFFEAVK